MANVIDTTCRHNETEWAENYSFNGATGGGRMGQAPQSEKTDEFSTLYIFVSEKGWFNAPCQFDEILGQSGIGNNENPKADRE